MKHILKSIIHNIAILYISIFFLILLVCSAAAVCGWEKYVVISGSMMPAIPVGSCIWVRKTTPEMLKEEDIISFSLSDMDTVVTHRIILRDTENRLVYTQGDANNQPDAAPVPYENILGKVVFSVPFFGYCLFFLSDPLGKIASISFLLLCFVLLKFRGNSEGIFKGVTSKKG